MFKPLVDALILRRYTEDWGAPMDRKVNPWDMNEADPGENGTMGTIPGPVIEATIGEVVTVHFRNADMRSDQSVLARCHSLHPHGFVFAPTSDGAYPLSPPDLGQAVGGEATLWAAVGVTQFKQGDRVPPPDLDAGGFGGTFTYTWETHSWPSTAGVWLYHDHSVMDMDNVGRGAIGIVVIHNTADPDDQAITDADLPDGSAVGSPIETHCFPIDFPVHILPHALATLRAEPHLPPGPDPGPLTRPLRPTPIPVRPVMPGMRMPMRGGAPQPGEKRATAPVARFLQLGPVAAELDRELVRIRQVCISRFRTPPARTQYLLLFHEKAGVGVCINGRKFLGNTPTLVASPSTHMRFGVVGMGWMFHTFFHIHGHRWVLPGPDGNNIGAIQGSPQVTAVSQFEDTRTFGPANSFVFAIDEGSNFKRAKPEAPSPRGEWHVHCHVLDHMMQGMMGSLLIVDGGELAAGLPHGTDPNASVSVPVGSTNPSSAIVRMQADPSNTAAFGFSFHPHSVTVAPAAMITFRPSATPTRTRSCGTRRRPALARNRGTRAPGPGTSWSRCPRSPATTRTTVECTATA